MTMFLSAASSAATRWLERDDLGGGATFSLSNPGELLPIPERDIGVDVGMAFAITVRLLAHVLETQQAGRDLRQGVGHRTYTPVGSNGCS